MYSINAIVTSAITLHQSELHNRLERSVIFHLAEHNSHFCIFIDDNVFCGVCVCVCMFICVIECLLDLVIYFKRDCLITLEFNSNVKISYSQFF